MWDSLTLSSGTACNRLCAPEYAGWFPHGAIANTDQVFFADTGGEPAKGTPIAKRPIAYIGRQRKDQIRLRLLIPSSCSCNQRLFLFTGKWLNGGDILPVLLRAGKRKEL